MGDGNERYDRTCDQCFSESALRVLEERYLIKDENGRPAERPSDMFIRISENIAAADRVWGASDADVEFWSHRFYDLMSSLTFLPNSPTLMNAGRDLQQLSACFVLPIEDSMESIFDTLRNTALIHKSGGGTGFSFSRLRPSGDQVQSTQGASSGPVSFMRAYNYATEAVKQGGTRRGANIAILRVDHPDILDFIESKAEGDLANFNISVALTDEFMLSLGSGGTLALRNPHTGDVTGELNPIEVLDLIVDQAWATGDPGIVFIDRINLDNPTPQLGAIESTNPCGEQPLLPYEACNLGSINLSRCIRDHTDGRNIDWALLDDTVRTAVRFLDNVIEVNDYPLPEIDSMTRGNRKIGLGVMGWADLLIDLGLPYDSADALELAGRVMGRIQATAKAASCDLAKVRGSFPNYEGSAHASSDCALPIRNATVTTIAPTGTLSIIASCSSGIEPLFAVAYTRNVMDGEVLREVHPLLESALSQAGVSEAIVSEIIESGFLPEAEVIPDQLRRIFVTAHEIEPAWHVRMQASFQEHTDNAVSKTVNLPNSATREDVRGIYRLAHELGLKGVTIYRDGSKKGQVLTKGRGPVSTETRLVANSRKPRERPSRLDGATLKSPVGCGSMYVTINSDENGVFELFAQIGKAGACAASQSEAMARLVSLAFRGGIDPREVAHQLQGISCPKIVGTPGRKIHSCSDAIGKAILNQLDDATTGSIGDFADDILIWGLCPNCGHSLEHEGGCSVCRVCGYSDCS